MYVQRGILEILNYKTLVMKKTLLSLILLCGLAWACNNDKKEEKSSTVDTTTKVAPAPMPDTSHGDSTVRGEQPIPPKSN